MCTATNATSPECNGSTCSYTCDTGYLDCDKGVGVDTDGCECNVTAVAAAPACCGTGCPTEHNYDENVSGAKFYDCVTSGTYNVTLATDACTAFAGGDSSQCDFNYTFGCTFPDGGQAGDMVCSDGPNAANCSCWGYDGALKGLMSSGSGKGSYPDGGPLNNADNCKCPSTIPWN
jgi:hypothetical protein